ncbi:hypothetical protein [Mammaliicoccus fleurettii]|uniref:hypothetical protein n=1 Tax=Mammaliicoccus fleurettii TaxID=150056 RepID=UPI0013587F18|nr:hypothetical protein [Mammaliicoccus fleurettii]
MYKTIMFNLIFALIIGLIYMSFNGISATVFYVTISFFIVLLLRDYIMYLIKKKKHD